MDSNRVSTLRPLRNHGHCKNEEDYSHKTSQGIEELVLLLPNFVNKLGKKEGSSHQYNQIQLAQKCNHICWQ